MNESNTPHTLDESQSPAHTAGSSGERNQASASLPLWIALLALGASIALAASAYFIWHQVQQLMAEQAGIEVGVSDRIRPLSSSLEGVNQSLRDERAETDNRIAAVDSRITGLSEDQKSIGHRLNVLAALMGRSEYGWTLAEVEYLLRIANQRLQLQRDLKTAAEALESADARLRELADPLYQGVREQIAIELNEISAVPVVDTEGLSSKLGAAVHSIDDLPVAGTRYQPLSADETAAPDIDKPAGNLKELMRLVWGALSELFRLREHDKPIGPMLPPEREYFLRENMRLQLAAARLALLRNDRAQFSAALITASDWLEAYFDNEDGEVQQLRSDLEAMSAVDISPPVPDVSASLALLRQQIKLSEKQDVLPVVPDETDRDDPLPESDTENPAEAPS